MHKSPILYFLGMASWLITILAALHLGALALGYNILAQDFFMMRPDLVKGIHYVFGIAGIISLILFFKHLAYKNKACGCGSNCNCY